MTIGPGRGFHTIFWDAPVDRSMRRDRHGTLGCVHVDLIGRESGDVGVNHNPIGEYFNLG